jgi:hypothetical protein
MLFCRRFFVFRPRLLSSHLWCLCIIMLFVTNPLRVALAGDVNVYKGTIGQKNIVAWLRFDADKVEGRYFYLGKDIDLVLTGSKQESWELLEKITDGRVTGKWSLLAFPNGIFAGAWHDPSGTKSLNIDVYIEGFGLKLYEELKKADQAKRQRAQSNGDSVVIGGEACKLEPSKDYFKLQRVLKKEHSITCEVHSCVERPEGIVAEMHRTLIAGHFMEEVMSSNGYCGGAYPINNEVSRTTYDLETGKVVKFSSLFADFENQQESILALLKPDKSVLGSWSSEQRKLFEDELCHSGRDGSFGDFIVDDETRELLYFGYFPHAIAVCSTLPALRARIEKLTPYLSDIGRALMGVSEAATSTP